MKNNTPASVAPEVSSSFLLDRGDELLLRCLTAEPGGGADSLLASLSPSDWEAVVGRAARHMLSCMLYQQLRLLGAEHLVPGALRQRLRGKFFKNAGTNMRHLHRLGELLEGLEEEGIPAIVLKGAFLAEALYGDIGAREMQDVDILVQQEDFARSHKWLARHAGYPDQIDLPLDLHWHLETNALPIAIDMEGVWRRAEPYSVGGGDARVLSPEDLLLHICVHLGIHHLFKSPGLRALFDIKACVAHSSERLDWGVVVGRAKRWHAANAVYLSLSAASELVGAEVPSHVLAALAPGDLEVDLEHWVYRQIFAGTQVELEISPHFCMMLQAAPLRQRLVNIYKLLFPRKEIISQRYLVACGSPRNYSHYLVRVWHHFKDYALVMVGMLSGDRKMRRLLEAETRRIAVLKWLTSR